MKIYLDMVGCRLNQSEIELIAQQFSEAGHDLTGDPDGADVAVVNTCTVTVAAAADSRKLIRRLARKGAGEVVVTGCWATLEPENAADLPGVSRVVSNEFKEQLVPDFLKLVQPRYEQEPLEREFIPGARFRTRANIKAQDGCDHRCTFCITTLARGKGRSTTPSGVIQQVNAAVRSGVQEMVLTGVQLGSWGRDLTGKPGLSTLLTSILEETEVPRIRLSSIEPWDVGPDLIEILTHDRVARHLHLPLQSGSDRTLKRMARMNTTRDYADLLARIRDAVPRAAVTTDLMTGFPGETEQDFNHSLEFVREMEFAGGHVFTYSPRPGTPAADFNQQVDYQVRKERNAVMREVLERSAENYRKQFLGDRVQVLWESVSGRSRQGWKLIGLSDHYIRVEARAADDLRNTFSRVKLTALTGEGMKGEIRP